VISGSEDTATGAGAVQYRAEFDSAAIERGCSDGAQIHCYFPLLVHDKYGRGMTRSVTELAVYNNALWCDAVCRAHGRPGEFHDTLWLNRLGTPRFYPDAATIAGVAAVPTQMEAVAALVGSSRLKEWAVKDSFQTLDLSSLGFEPLFDAEWVALDEPARDWDPLEYRIARASSEAELMAWEHAWAADRVDAAAISESRVFEPRLLADANIVFVSIAVGEEIVGGGILNRGAEVVGLSNLFGPAMVLVWRALAASAAEIFPGLPMVGYDRGDELAAARQVGFETVGPLRVWRRPAGLR
jgi:hypothetical protein